jgi:hypothetical protein
VPGVAAGRGVGCARRAFCAAALRVRSRAPDAAGDHLRRAAVAQPGHHGVCVREPDRARPAAAQRAPQRAFKALALAAPLYAPRHALRALRLSMPPPRHRPADGGRDAAVQVQPGVPPDAGWGVLVRLQRHVPPQLRLSTLLYTWRCCCGARGAGAAGGFAGARRVLACALPLWLMPPRVHTPRARFTTARRVRPRMRSEQQPRNVTARPHQRKEHAPGRAAWLYSAGAAAAASPRRRRTLSSRSNSSASCTCSALMASAS